MLRTPSRFGSPRGPECKKRLNPSDAMATKRAEPLSKRRGDSQRHSFAALPSHSPSISDTSVLSIVTVAPRLQLAPYKRRCAAGIRAPILV